MRATFLGGKEARLSRHLITLATALLPPSRRAWGQAMKAEYDALPAGQSAFALGCLGASLRENVTTGEGWARMGFGVVLVLAGLLTLSFLEGLVGLIAEPRRRMVMQVASILMILGLMLKMAMIGCAALEAMAAPINRHYLAKIGLKTAPRLLFILGLVSVVSLIAQAYVHTFVLPVWLGPERAKVFLIDGGVACIVVLAVAFLSRISAKMMLVSALAGACTLGVSGVIVYYLDRGKLEGIFVASDQYAILLLLFALSGAILMWMERPARTIG
jgi:hypothetical protein